MMATIVYKIPKDLIDSFIKDALKNKGKNGHIESLALVVGHRNGNQLIAKDLIFPKQRGTSSSVEDLGKYSLVVHVYCLPKKIKIFQFPIPNEKLKIFLLFGTLS